MHVFWHIAVLHGRTVGLHEHLGPETGRGCGAEGIAGQLGTWMTCAVISSEAHAGVGGNMRETKQPAVNAAATENVATMRFILVLPSVLLAADAMPGANR
jgi:hypothetical protein